MTSATTATAAVARRRPDCRALSSRSVRRAARQGSPLAQALDCRNDDGRWQARRAQANRDSATATPGHSLVHDLHMLLYNILTSGRIARPDRRCAHADQNPLRWGHSRSAEGADQSHAAGWLCHPGLGAGEEWGPRHSTATARGDDGHRRPPRGPGEAPDFANSRHEPARSAGERRKNAGRDRAPDGYVSAPTFTPGIAQGSPDLDVAKIRSRSRWGDRSGGVDRRQKGIAPRCVASCPPCPLRADPAMSSKAYFLDDRNGDF
jgi:hypothetical protein